MKVKITSLLILFLSATAIFGQFTADQSIYMRHLSKKSSNTLAIGGGFSNFIMHGDLRSIGTGNLGNFYNFGGFFNVQKMFNPLVGLELKGFYTQISGGAQSFSEVYEILYVPTTVIRNNMYFKGRSYGLELNFILSFSNLYKVDSERWNTVGYFGGGYHFYDSQLFEKLADGTSKSLIDFGFNPSKNGTNTSEAKSIYLSLQFGIKRRINRSVDLELRTGMYFNYKDHLDATISNKQDWETFFISGIGVNIKIGKQKKYIIWGNRDVRNKRFIVVDSDRDGVIDELDKEPNTPKGAIVYGNGVAIDSDTDGVQDYKDKCPLAKGLPENEGCIVLEEKNKKITYDISYVSTNVYFDSNKADIRAVSLPILNRMAKLMLEAPKAKFVIEGHTDNRGKHTYNLELSQKRANVIKDYLISKGVGVNQLTSIRYGETRPKFSNETHESRQLNRRVEIKLINNYD